MRPLTLVLLVLGALNLIASVGLAYVGRPVSPFSSVAGDLGYVVLVLLLWHREREIDHA